MPKSKFKTKETPKCKVNAEWFTRKDPAGRLISSWAVKDGDSGVFCKACKKKFSCESKGFQGITQHELTQTHQNKIKEFFEPNQSRLHILSPGSAPLPLASTPPTATQDQGPSSAITLYTLKDKAVSAELRWVLKCISSNFSTASCDGIENLFRAMFGDGVPESFSLASTKAGYYLTEALGQFFRDELLEEVSNAFYTLHFDETTNAEGWKELQVALQFWSSKADVDEVVFRHLETFFMGKATGDILTEKLEEALNNGNLSVTKMLTLGRDGPMVNKKVFRKMDEIVKSARGSGLLDIGSCNLHIEHNAFLAGLEEFGMDVDVLVLAVFHFFDGWPLRLEEFLTIQAKLKLPLRRFLKHVSSRWLTLGPAAKRVQEQWDALYEYFVKEIPKEPVSVRAKKLMGLTQYKNIVTALKDPFKRAEVAFVVESAEFFERHSKSLQKSEPMIHVLYEDMQDLVALIMRKAFKPETTMTLASVVAAENLLPLNKVECGQESAKILKNSKLSELRIQLFRTNVQKHYAAAATHLIGKSVLSTGQVVKHFRCLKPEERDKDRSDSSILKVAKALPLEVDENALVDEWRLLRVAKDVKTRGQNGSPLRIDHYWRQFFSAKNSVNEPKYKNITSIVKAALSITHGSSDIERGFSDSGAILTPEKACMKVETLNAKLNIRSGMKRYGGKPELVPINKKLLALARSANGKYKDHLEVQRKKMEDTARKQVELEEERKRQEELVARQNKVAKDIASLEEDLKKAKEEYDSKSNAADRLLKQANDSLKRCLNSQDLEGVRTAQGMLEGANVIKKDAADSGQRVEELQKTVEKRKSKLISSLMEKRPRTS